ncbi:hypothetical protein AB0L00_10755 [Actinoallomurus sp. NPDC052308]|uniref:hypothetical protein n=1 Tax=Actinoallomurus sp. NPDC052308 TaxID=3155530 RepID=UPI0034426A49
MRGRRMLLPAAATLLLAGLVAVALLPSGAPRPGPLALALALGTPACCTAWLLAGLDGAARGILAGLVAIALNAAVAEVMLVCSMWSPRGGLVAVAAVSAGLMVPAWAIRAKRGNSPETPFESPVDMDGDDESWAFDG